MRLIPTGSKSEPKSRKKPRQKGNRYHQAKTIKGKNYKLQPCRKSRSYNERYFPWKHKLVRGTRQPTYLHRNKVNTFTGATKGFAGTSRNNEHLNSLCKAAAFLIGLIQTSSNSHNPVQRNTVLTWDTRQLYL